MIRTVLKIIVYLLPLIAILALPLIYKDRKSYPVIGPQLNELTYSEVSFINLTDSTKLAGMLFLPENQGSSPVAIIIHGSGTSHRSNPWYLSVAKHLQSNGIAVLLPDKRGSEKSEGNWIGADLKTLATDTESAVNFVKTQKIFRYSEIGIIGMSQGGWIAPIVASTSNDLSFVVSLSGTTVTTDEQLLYEEYHNIEPYTYNFIARMISPLTAKQLKKRNDIAPFVGFDPIPYWKKVVVPVFFAYGEHDLNCPVEESIARLEENDLDRFNTKVYPNGGHGILENHSQQVNPLFLYDLTRFIWKSVHKDFPDEFLKNPQTLSMDLVLSKK